ncbi:MAG: SpoIIE family protein phosphatase [Planctomycetes bacterium]|nr:SpoIIE family protein phosphatase [Planctomycetota bacterium]
MDPGAAFLVVTAERGLGQAIAEALRAKGLAAAVVGPAALPDGPRLEAFRAAIVDSRAGEETLRRVARAVAHVVLAGARQGFEDALRALRAGARDYLPFDFRPEELDAATARAMERTGAAAPVLELQDPAGEVLRVRLDGPSLTIGRDPSNDLRLDAAVVSRFHARILRRGDGFVVVDNASHHGTYVDEARVTEAPLEDGARVRLGTLEAPVLTFRAAPGPAAPTLAERAAEPPPGPGQEIRDIAGLVDTFLKLNGDLLLEDVLGIVVARSIELAGADRGMILLADGDRDRGGGGDRGGSLRGRGSPGGGSPGAGGASPGGAPGTGEPAALRLAMARGRGGEPLEGEGLLISRKIPEEVLRTGTGVIREDLLAPEAGEHPATIQLGVRSVLCVPLRVRPAGPGPREPQVLGVLYVDSSSRARPFPRRHLHALESLAAEAAHAIFSSRLYEECLAARELDAEMRIARDIQRHILPAGAYANPWVELHGSYQSAKEVGGDLLDYYPFGEERVTVVVGDVSGKGASAAIFASMLDGLCYGLAARAGQGQDLGAAAADLNRYLVTKSGLQKFATLVFATLWADGRLAYLNAGHDRPLIVRAGGPLEILSSGGTIMGMLEEATYRPGEARLEPGDLLVVFSDGLTDARAPSGERFGAGRLLEAAAAHRGRSARETHDGILAAVSRFGAGVPAADDVTLLVVRKLR